MGWPRPDVKKLLVDGVRDPRSPVRQELPHARPPSGVDLSTSALRFLAGELAATSPRTGPCRRRLSVRRQARLIPGPSALRSHLCPAGRRVRRGHHRHLPVGRRGRRNPGSPGVHLRRRRRFPPPRRSCPWTARCQGATVAGTARDSQAQGSQGKTTCAVPAVPGAVDDDIREVEAKGEPAHFFTR